MNNRADERRFRAAIVFGAFAALLVGPPSKTKKEGRKRVLTYGAPEKHPNLSENYTAEFTFVDGVLVKVEIHDGC